MPRRPSKSEIDRLGERLRDAHTLDDEDVYLLQRWRRLHDEPMARVASILRDELALRPTSRLKTETTIVDKLRRETIRLSQVQDIAGLRVVEDVTLREQEVLARSIQEALPSSRLIDRRRESSYGYRAIHVVAGVDELQVEIQVRSELQDLWAQLMERLGDRLGRDIRYGVLPAGERARRGVQTVLALSDLVREVEERRQWVADTRERAARLADRLARERSDAAEIARRQRALPSLRAHWRLLGARRREWSVARIDRSISRSQAEFRALERSLRDELRSHVAWLESLTR